MKKTGVWLMAILLILQCCISGCAQSDNGKDDTIGEVSTITTTAQTTVNTTTSNTINISTTSITESITADTSTTTKSVESKPTVRRYDQILSKKTIKNTYILSTKYPNDLNNHCVVRTLSEQENALLTNLFNAPNVTFREERDGWVKYIPSRPNEYAMAIDFTDDTCMILAIHFDRNNRYTYYIATTMTNDKYDQETDYKELEFTRWIASSEFGESLSDIVFNYNP